MPPLPPRPVIDARDAEAKSKKYLGLTSKTLIGDELDKDCRCLEKYVHVCTLLYVLLIATEIHLLLLLLLLLLLHAQQSLLSDCLSALRSWFCHNGLARNSSESESILIGTRQCLHTFSPFASPKIAGIPNPFSETTKMLGGHTGLKLDLK